jgi:hypothetical protein
VKVHKYKVGQLVGYGGMGRHHAGPLNYKIVARVPENARGPQYRIKGNSEPYERTVNEMEISVLDPTDK